MHKLARIMQTYSIKSCQYLQKLATMAPKKVQNCAHNFWTKSHKIFSSYFTQKN